jgi:hypothetical protein
MEVINNKINNGGYMEKKRSALYTKVCDHCEKTYI